MIDSAGERRGLTRAGLLKAGAAAALALGVTPAGRALASGAAGSVVGRSSAGPLYLRRESYLPLVGDAFRIQRRGLPPLRVRLVDVRPLPGKGEAFSLLFRGERHLGLQSGVHRIGHRSFGGFDLFLGPVGRGAKGQDLEAVVNRIAA